MNNCDKISELINAYADGEATEKEKELVEVHIKECVSCKQKLDFILKTKDILKATPKMPVPETLLKDFEEYRKKEEESAKKVIPFYKNYRMYASVAAIFIFAFVLKSGLWQEGKYMPDTINQPPVTEQHLISPAIDNDEAKDEVIVNEKSKTAAENKTYKAKAVTEDVTGTQAQNISEDSVNSAVSDIATADASDNQTVPVTTASDVSYGGGAAYEGNQEAVPMARTIEEPEKAEVFEETEVPSHAIVYVSEEDLQKAAQLLSEGEYFYAQVEQKLNDNRIPFESNFLSLDESVPHRVVVMVKE